ncbi:alpha-xylosidase [Ruminococcus sp.]|uniref:alpha-xylosidase n=1 Tax=Ruminococcus sp. TaxID=41978 RepID=UPI0025D171D9|nr:alpha-xylosidase [Ruminococcus sp.]MBQ9542952.1 alpha-xylosidase [Ruminococcus sp.]
MKFADGFWLNQRGYDVNYVNQAYDIVEVENGFMVVATPFYGRERYKLLGSANLEITYTSDIENVIKVNITHHKGYKDNGPHFVLNKGDYKPTVTIDEHKAVLVSGDTRVEVSRDSWSVSYYYKDKKLTSGGWRSTGVIFESAFKQQARLATQADDTFWSYPADENRTYIREQLDTTVGEYFYGFGEKFTTFAKNGQNVEIWNADGGTCSDQSYKSVPFYVSSRGYGIFVNSSDKVSFEVCSDTVSKVSFTLPGESLEYFVFGGEDLTQVMKGYTDLTGKPSLPPAFSFGLWLTSSFTTSYDEATITSFIDGMAERDIPLQVFHFDCFWMKGLEWCNFEWDTEQFPDPEGLLKRLHETKGLKTCVWINPYVGQRSRLFDEGMEHGYFIKKKDGSVFQCDEWQPGMAIVDFTNPDACKWYAGYLRKLCEMGVDTFKTDFGERIPTRDVVYFDGSDPIKMHNYYTYLYNECVFNVLKEYYGENKACLFARSATAGGQKFPVHWGGDCSGNYNSMAEVVRGCLSLCISGFGYTSHDMAGFEATATPDIYKRWAAFGLFSTHSRLHGNQSYRVPWLFDEESCDVLRFFTKKKGELMPYLWAQAIKTHEVGVTMMRAMVIDFANDPACLTLDRQYMLGDNILVAPILNEDGIAQYYVPAGRWTDIITGKVFEGGKWYTHKCNYFEIPALAKPNSIIAYGDFKRDFEYDYLDGTNFTIYELEDGKTAVCPVYDTEANKVFELTATRNGSKIECSYTETKANFKITVANTDKVAEVTPTVGSGKVIIDL